MLPPNLSSRYWYLFRFMGITCTKKVLGIIVGMKYIDNKRYYMVNNEPLSYENALKELGLNSLKHRREILTSKFALEY